MHIYRLNVLQCTVEQSEHKAKATIVLVTCNEQTQEQTVSPEVAVLLLTSQQSWATDLSWTPWVDKSKVAPALLLAVYHGNAGLQTVYVPHPLCVCCLNTKGRTAIAKGFPARAWCIRHDSFASVPSTCHVRTKLCSSRGLSPPGICGSLKLECQGYEGIQAFSQSWSSCMWSRPRRQWPVSSLSVHNTDTHTYTHYNDLTDSSIP